jgi:hypothetical protein
LPAINRQKCAATRGPHKKQLVAIGWWAGLPFLGGGGGGGGFALSFGSRGYPLDKQTG